MMERIKELREFTKTRPENKMYQALWLKVYLAYLLNFGLLGRKKFKLVFNGKHIHSFKERFFDRIRYTEELIDYYVFLVISKIFNIEITNYKPFKCMNLQITNAPNEPVLYKIAEMNNLVVADEILEPVRTIYIIKKAEDQSLKGDF